MSNYKYLVFSGGGAAGVAYAGALEQLGKESDFSFNQIEGVAGTSVGAIAALVVSLKYTPDEAAAKLASLDLKKLADGSSFPYEIHDLFSKYGKYKGDEVYKFILSLIKEKTHREDPENITFADLKKLGFIDLHVVATKMYKVDDKATGKKKVFSPQDTPDTPVAAAIRASYAAPLYFQRVRLKKIYKGKYVLDESGNLFSDGGLVDNYPIEIFDQPKYMTLPKDNCINPHTLGLALCTADQIREKKRKAIKTRIEDGHPIDGIKGVVNTLLINYNQEGLDQRSNRDRTIEIDRLGVALGQFNMGEKTKSALIASGSQAVRDYFHPELKAEPAEIDIKKSACNSTLWSTKDKSSENNNSNTDQKCCLRRCTIL